MRIGKPVKTVKVPKTRHSNPEYDEVMEAIVGPKPGQSIPVECDTPEDANRVYQALSNRFKREDLDGFRLRRRGSITYVDYLR